MDPDELIVLRVQYLVDNDPFNCMTMFPIPTRAPTYSFVAVTPLATQLGALLRLLGAPQRLDDAALQVYKDGDYGTYLDLESSLAEQCEDIEGLPSSRKNSLVIRTQLSVRVHTIIEKLLTCEGRDLRRSLFSLKQIFQEDKDLVHGFVALGGLNCLVQIGSGADQNYQNYILRALGQVMLYVDGMNGVMQHGPTIQWLYSLIASKYRLVVKTALKLLLVFVEYCEGNCYLLVNAIRTVDSARGTLPWSNIMKLLKDYENADTELLIYATSLVNKTLSGLSDQDNFYDESDFLEQQGMEGIVQRYMSRPGTDLDLLDQLQLYEAVLRFEDGEIDGLRIPDNTVRKTLRYRTTGSDTAERRKSKRHSTTTSPCVPPPPVPPLPQQYSPMQTQQTLDEDSSSSANSGDLNGVFRDCRENGQREGAGVTPGLRRRRERAERQKSFMHQQQELINGNVEDDTNGRDNQLALLGLKNGNSSPPVCVNGSKPFFLLNNNKPNGVPSTKSVISHPADDNAPAKLTNGKSSSLDTHRNRYTDVEPDTNGNNVRNGYHQKFEKLMNSINYQDKNGVGPGVGGAGSYYNHIRNGYNYTSNLLPKGTDKSYYGKVSSSPPSSNSSTTGSIVSIDSGIGSTNGHSNYSSLETIPATTSPALLVGDLDGNGNAIDLGSEMVEVESENEDKNIILQLKREQTVKDLTQKLSSLPLSPSQEDKPRIVGDMSGLINKAKEGLAKSKSKGDISRSPSHEHDLKPTPKASEPKKSENEVHWEELVKNMSRQLTLCDLDFTDLTVDDEKDVLAPRGLGGSIPPPPPPCGMMAPPPMNMFPPAPNNLMPSLNYRAMNGDGPKMNGDPNGAVTIQKNKKTVKLFWKEVREDMIPAIVERTVWDELPRLEVDTQKLEHLFESRAKDLMTKKQQELNKNKEIIVLDHKRSNAINIAITKLPPPRAIKAAILKMDQTVVTREGIEKLMNMLPTDEERCKIQEAQVLNPELPLGSAEQFLLTLSSISELAARLKLWAFKLDFENIEKEIAEPLMDLKQGLELLKANSTFKCILSTLLSIGIFLNGAPVKGFQVEYLAKVPEVKDTVHKHSLLHHLCHMVMESSPTTTDLYSEIGPITRASKADFTDLAHNIAYLETECKASWDRLKLISKHDTAPQLKQKLVDFLADCAERIIILDIVHRRVINRFRKFLLWLGVPQHRIAESRPNDFCRIISEFALEYRTTRERVQQQIEKKANHRERNKTRGKMIIDFTKIKTKEDTADAELRQLLDSPSTGKENGEGNGFQTWRRRRGDNLRSPGVANSNNGNHHRDESFTDGDDELLETLVKTATKASTPRAVPRERKRTRHADRKSLRRTLKTGLNDEEKQQVASYIKGY